MSPTKVLTKALSDAIPPGPHPDPRLKLIQVRLDLVQLAIDHIVCLDRGVDEWREEALSQQQKFYAAQATVKIAVRHLQEVLNKPRMYDDQVRVDTNARDWLESIGSEPE
jgi:hypothetical protein